MFCNIISLSLIVDFIVSSGRCFKIHEHMSPGELKSLFHVNDVSTVPDYELVPLHHGLINRTHANIKIETKRVKKKLNLKTVESNLIGENTPVWLVTLDVDGVSETFIPLNKAWENAIIYQDLEHKAALMKLSDDQENVYYEGTVGSDLVLRPLPPNVLDRISNDKHYRNRRSANCQNKNDCTYHHVVFSRNSNGIYRGRNFRNRTKRALKDIGVANGNQYSSFVSEEENDENRSANNKPETVYPKVLVIIDNALHKLLGDSYPKTLNYVMTFMNAVDLRFKHLTAPKIELNVAGVVISTSDRATPYEVVREDIRDSDGFAGLDIMSSIDRMSRYFFSVDIDCNFDIAMVLTGYNAFDFDDEDGDIWLTTGLSPTGGLCLIKKNRFPGVMIAEDVGMYHGVLTAAHELTHLFNVEHDGELESADCDPHDGFLMTPYEIHNRNKFFWSECSKRAMSEFFNSERGTCVYEKPKVENPFDFESFPGKYMSLDQQCRVFFRNKYPEAKTCDLNNKNQEAINNICVVMGCKKTPGSDCEATTTAAQGTVCGDDKHCVSGECVSTKIKVNFHNQPDSNPVKPKKRPSVILV